VSDAAERLFALVPSPSWPEELSPQHRTPPAVVRAQVWLKPAAMALAQGAVALLPLLDELLVPPLHATVSTIGSATSDLDIFMGQSLPFLHITQS
jgi:hypothetical protein